MKLVLISIMGVLLIGCDRSSFQLRTTDINKTFCTDVVLNNSLSFDAGQDIYDDGNSTFTRTGGIYTSTENSKFNIDCTTSVSGLIVDPIDVPINVPSFCFGQDSNHYVSDNLDICITPIDPIDNPVNVPGLCIDHDGDGYGWDGLDTCEMPYLNNGYNHTNGNCVDTDGDGYGWDGLDTCIISSDDNNSIFGNNRVDFDAPSAYECEDTDGDGIGYNGVGVCSVNYF